MSPRYFLLPGKWPLAVEKALNNYNKAPSHGEVHPVDFHIGPPTEGRLPVVILVDGRRALLFELSDVYPSFLHELREWLERCLVFDHRGRFHPEFLTLDCADHSVITLVLIHGGWDEAPGRAAPVSFLTVVSEDSETPLLHCFCFTLDVIWELYEGVIRCLERYRRLFDDPSFWYNVRMFDRLDPRSITDRMLDEFRSPIVEKKCGKVLKK